MVVGKQEPQTAATIGPDPVGRKAGSRRIRISGGFRAFQILKTPHEIEQTHRQDDAQLRDEDLARLPERFDEQARRVPSERLEGLRERGRIRTDQPRHPGERGPDQDREQATRDRKLDPAEIREQDDAKRHERHDWIFISAEEEAKRDEGQSDAGERRKECRARQPPAKRIGKHAADQLDHARSQTGDEPGLPGQGDRLIHGGAPVERDQFHRQHDKKDMREEADRVDPVGQGGTIVASFSDAQPISEPTVVHVADNQAQGDGREDAPVDELRRIAQQSPAQSYNQENLNEVVEGQPQQAIDVLSHEPARPLRLSGVRVICWQHERGSSGATVRETA